MILHYFKLPRYDWEVFAYYGVTPKYKDVIIDQLKDMGCREEYIHKSLDLIETKKVNTGFTYSNDFNQQSVVVVSECESSEDFMNTLVHEARHLQQHIQDTYHLSDDSEELYYLMGAIVQIMYNKSKPLLEFM